MQTKDLEWHYLNGYFRQLILKLFKNASLSSWQHIESQYISYFFPL